MNTEQKSAYEKQRIIQTLDTRALVSQVIIPVWLSRGYADHSDQLDEDACLFVDPKAKRGSGTTVIVPVVGNLNVSLSGAKTHDEVIGRILKIAQFQARVGKEKVFPQEILIVCSGRASAQVLSRIVAKVGDARIKIADHRDIVEWIDEFCPAIWGGIISRGAPLLSAFIKLVDEYSILRAGDASLVLGTQGGVLSAGDDCFVELKLIRPSSSTVTQHGKFVEKLDFEEVAVDELLKLRSNRILILGEAGTGKSTLLIRLAYIAAKRGMLSGKSEVVPLPVRAVELVGVSEGSSLLDACVASVRKLTGHTGIPFVEEDLLAGKVLVLIDGLDEIPTLSGRQVLVRRINELSAMYPRVSVVVTARPYESLEQIDGIRAFVRYRISPISLRDAERMLARLGSSSIDENRAREVMRKLDAVHGLELNPLFVTVFGLVAGSNKKDLPANVTELFSKFTELMLGRWDHSKGIALQYQARLKEYLLSSYAFILHRSRRTRFSREEFSSHAAWVLSDLNLSADLDTVLVEILDRSGLLRGNGDEIEFRHHMLQEYFAGRGISSIDFVTDVVSDEWWRTPIVFYFGAEPSSIDKLVRVIQFAPASAHATVGLALQTAYLSPFNERIKVWKWVISSAAIEIKEIIGDSNEKYPLLNFVGHYLMARDSVALSGIERNDVDAIDWAVNSHQDGVEADYRRFWAYASLIEMGEIEILLSRLESSPLVDERLNAALYVGCSFVFSVRAVDERVRRLAVKVCKKLEKQTAGIRQTLAAEFRGRLLEYRRGAIVAFDEAEASAQ